MRSWKAGSWNIHKLKNNHTPIRMVGLRPEFCAAKPTSSASAGHAPIQYLGAYSCTSKLIKGATTHQASIHIHTSANARLGRRRVLRATTRIRDVPVLLKSVKKSEIMVSTPVT